MFKTVFKTNIDAYRRFLTLYPNYLPFRPELKDEVPFLKQEIMGSVLPVLTIINIKYNFDEMGNVYFVCELHFSESTPSSIKLDVLNHKFGG